MLILFYHPAHSFARPIGKQIDIMDIPPVTFSQKVWQLAVSIPPGAVTTYGILAATAGGGAYAARSITGILSKAPNQASIPYHRIVYANGRPWLTDTNRRARLKQLNREGIELDDNDRIINFADKLYYFD